MSRARGARRLAAAAAVALLVAAGAGACSEVSVSAVDVPETFDVPLPVPPLAPSRVAADGTRTFRLTAQEGSTQFTPGVDTPTWGFDGDLLGPTLRAARGEQVAVEVRNTLPEATSVHWHGMHLPAAMDGGPHQSVEPGATWRPTWRVDQPAATLWYHPHPHGETQEHVYRGLAGFFLLDDPAAPDVGLPTEYGVDDVPVVVQDRNVDRDGSLDMSGGELGVLGSLVTTNGVRGAHLPVTTQRVRLRLLNGSTARTYAFGFEDDRSFLQVASDGGLLPEPLPTTRVQLSPGERAEVVVTAAPGETVRLRSYPPDLGRVVAGFAMGAQDTFDVLELRAAPTLAPSPEVASTLTTLEPLSAADADVTRTFELQDRSINGRRMDMDRIDVTAELDTTEVWEVRNRNAFPHSLHVHDVQMRVLDIDGEAPPPALAGAKDTVYLAPNRTYRLIMRFEDYADPDVPYMFHCHLLLHEDQGMMGQLVVVDPDDTTGGRSSRDEDGTPPGRDGAPPGRDGAPPGGDGAPPGGGAGHHHG
ncbi:multicopper oxidase family protein [Cellulomonas sp. KH9]|uniref:multicopper oxidase family protein n=1 Tax=Cellulomonas sp. KH9 TaxID=1855324 RepID=UPI0008E9526C|nr:multicopper oxidase domain-containing protein [Cellulomonas sp. KH9]SFJ71686.1 Multicopper oxidase with three cupredoxin domains (includes cell division protein FtsP and spore coat protein CotA) [Cellulomonas sp. KH9]